MTAIEKIANALVWLVAGIAILFLLAPLAITIAVSLGDSAVFTLPPPGWSFRWYERLPTRAGSRPRSGPRCRSPGSRR